MSIAAYVQKVQACWRGERGHELAHLLSVAGSGQPRCTAQELQSVSGECSSLRDEPQLVQVIVEHLGAASRAAEGDFVKAHQHQLQCQT
jgi:hypothetical protein